MAVPLLFIFISSCSNDSSQNDIQEDLNVSSRTESLTRDFCDFKCYDRIFEREDIFIVEGCSIKVTYTVQYCDGWTAITNLNWRTIFSRNCGWKDLPWWENFYENGFSYEANQAINMLIKELTLMIEDKELTIRINNEGTNIENGQSQIVHFVETSCHTLCTGEENDPFNPFFIYHAKCGESCCLRITDVKIIDGDFFKTSRIVPSNKPCDPTTIENGCISPSAICNPACSRL